MMGCALRGDRRRWPRGSEDRQSQKEVGRRPSSRNRWSQRRRALITVSGGRPVLTAQGYVVAAALLLLFATINVLGVRWLAETNKLAVCWKIFVPALTVVALLATSAHRENFSAGGGFMPFGWKGVFVALSSGGVIFACLGFEQAVQLGGESRSARAD